MLAWVKAALCQHSLDSRTWLWPSSVKISPQLLKNVISQSFYFLGCLDRCIFYLLWLQKAINNCWSSIIHSNKYVIHKSIGVVVCVTFFCTNAFQCLWLHQLLTNSEFFFFFSVTELVHIRLDPNWHLIYVCSEVPYEQNMDAEESTGGENT